jgi:hypothetical protein
VDTPIVNIGFDVFATPPPVESVVRIYDFTHYANIVSTGGVRIARSAEDMIRAVNDYLADPSLDRAGRARIVDEQCYRVDGQSGARVGRLLLGLMGIASSRRQTAASPASAEAPLSRA